MGPRLLEKDYIPTPIGIPTCIHVISSKAAKPSSFTRMHSVLMVNTGIIMLAQEQTNTDK
jgi:hypothetical protein